MTHTAGKTYDAIVIGGGAAGLSAAVTLGRALRSALVIDSGAPRNAPAAGIHNFLTRDGISPGEFLALGRSEVSGYGGEIVDGEVVDVGSAADLTVPPTDGRAADLTVPLATDRTTDLTVPPTDGRAADFTVTLADGRAYRGRRLLVTTGLVDRLPDIPGLAQRWGSTVVHCPYCHGYEIRGRSIGVLATSAHAPEQVRLWRQWSPDVQLFEVDEIAAVEDGGVRKTDGSFVARDHLVVAGKLEARSGFLASIGLKTVDHPMGFGTHVPAVDPTGRTEVPGVWVAGNVTDPMAQVITAAAQGLMAAAMINADLLPPAPGTR